MATYIHPEFPGAQNPQPQPVAQMRRFTAPAPPTAPAAVLVSEEEDDYYQNTWGKVFSNKFLLIALAVILAVLICVSLWFLMRGKEKKPSPGKSPPPTPGGVEAHSAEQPQPPPGFHPIPNPAPVPGHAPTPTPGHAPTPTPGPAPVPTPGGVPTPAPPTVPQAQGEFNHEEIVRTTDDNELNHYINRDLPDEAED